jgi:hypothetical protein
VQAALSPEARRFAKGALLVLADEAPPARGQPGADAWVMLSYR